MTPNRTNKRRHLVAVAAISATVAGAAVSLTAGSRTTDTAASKPWLTTPWPQTVRARHRVAYATARESTSAGALSSLHGACN